MDISLEWLISKYTARQDHDKALQMAAYMQNKAPFLGISKPQRNELEKPFILEWLKLPLAEIMALAKNLVELNYREYLYTAQQLLLKVYPKLSTSEIEQLLELAQINPWWDNIDGWVMVIRRWSAKDLQRASWLVNKYSQHPDMWLRRMSIICQINHKSGEYDQKALFSAIENNLWDKEFFIQKAIGWALRDYSEHQPQAVMAFIQLHQQQLSTLAIREATRKINTQGTTQC